MGLHQGSSLSPRLFAMVMDRMTDEIRLWRENMRGKTEVNWACTVCTEEQWWVHWENDVDDGPPKKEETGKAKKEVNGCGERGNGRD